MMTRHTIRAALTAAVLAMLCATVAAQQLPSGSVWGNSGATTSNPNATTLNTLFNRVYGSTPGFVIYRGAGAWVAAAPGATSGVQAWDTDLDCYAGLSATGFLAHTGAGTCASRTLTGTANEITVANGDGSGVPTWSLPAALTFTGKTVTGGTFSGVALTGSSTINGNTVTTGTGTLTIAAGKTATHNATTTFAGTDGKTLTISNSGTLAGGDAYTLAIAASKTLTVSNSITLAGTDATTMTFPSVSATIPRVVASGAKALATSAISSAACTTAQTDTATGTLTTDAIIVSFNGDPTAVTGYVPLTTGMLTIIVYPTADTFNAKVCNNTLASITPGAITLNWRVIR